MGGKTMAGYMPLTRRQPMLGLAVIANIFFVLLASIYVMTNFKCAANARLHAPGPAHSEDTDSSTIAALSSGNPEADSLKCALYRLRNKQATIVFHHIHKCGGTSVCRALVLSNSSLMGCRLEDAGKVVVHPYNEECNCNGHASTLPSPFSLGTEETEQLLQRHKQHLPAAFFNEDGLANPAWFGPNAVQMVVMRNPVDRYLSHMFHVLIDDFKVDTSENLSRTNISEYVMFHTKTPTGANGWVADNAATRFLAGGPLEGPLTRADLMRAVHNMDRMEVVLTMEGMERASGLLQDLGLKSFNSNTRGGTSFSSLTNYGTLTPGARRHLESREQMDIILYGIAKLRHNSLIAEHAHWKKAVAANSTAKKIDPAANPAAAALARAAAAAATVGAGSCRTGSFSSMYNTSLAK